MPSGRIDLGLETRRRSPPRRAAIRRRRQIRPGRPGQSAVGPGESRRSLRFVDPCGPATGSACRQNRLCWASCPPIHHRQVESTAKAITRPPTSCEMSSGLPSGVSASTWAARLSWSRARLLAPSSWGSLLPGRAIGRRPAPAPSQNDEPPRERWEPWSVARRGADRCGSARHSCCRSRSLISIGSRSASGVA